MTLRSLAALMLAGGVLSAQAVPVVQTSLTDPKGAPLFGLTFAGSSTTSYTIELSVKSDLTGWLQLMSPTTTFSAIGLQDPLGNSFSGPVANSGTFSFYDLSAGKYKLSFTFSDPGFGGFVGSVTATPSVPEPQDWALALGGLGVMGMLALRRKPG